MLKVSGKRIDNLYNMGISYNFSSQMLKKSKSLYAYLKQKFLELTRTSLRVFIFEKFEKCITNVSLWTMVEFIGSSLKNHALLNS